ncbi:hypothetical protein ILUMI_05920 [Ignelater luminosus]|uniref:Origin recognition complex subunit 5 n=1 Tax=Ignelater luminosus TaxID=2038154 RepID=A0A8K0GFX1_IGNLU|nr:hypothetical protein ILUMI_05920 [Ignelater luminosus]
MDSLVNQLKMNFPGRTYQIERLFSLFGYKNEPFVSSVFIYGPSSTGKSAVVGSLLDGLEIRNACVNLVECYSSKVLFESILNQLSGHKIDPFKGHPYAKCDNVMDFIFNLRKCADEVDLNKSVIVLDKAERLRNMDYNLLPAFLKLKELSGLSVSVIFISEIIFEKYYFKARTLEPIKIHFSQYTREELWEILRLDFDHVQNFIRNNFNENFDINEEFFSNYLNLFLSVFYRVCRDLSELRHMSKLNFVKYCEPVFKKECKLEDSMGLWRHIAPILKASLEVLYLRISPVSQEGKQQSVEIKCDGARTVKQFTFSKESLAQFLELPFYAKYLLIAAYLASYNPPKEDKRLFMKYHGKKTKRMKDVKAKNIVSEQLNTQLGPKPFGFERLVAIFYAILEEKVDFNSNLLVQISTLVELQLLSMVSDNCDLDSRKYKCCVSFEFIQIISKTVDFNITKYLVDFN